MAKTKHQDVLLKTTSIIQAKIIDNSCARKKQYANKNIAKTKAALSTQKKGEFIEAYKCRFSNGHYHIGHPRRIS